MKKNFLGDISDEISSFFKAIFSKNGVKMGLYYKMKYLKQATHLYSRINTACHF